MGALRSERAERVLRKSARRDILNRGDVLQLTILVPGRMSDGMHVLDRAVGHQQTVVPFESGVAASCLVDHFHLIDQTDVFRMDSSTDQFARHRHAYLKLVDAIELL